jgi:hypothetical protein
VRPISSLLVAAGLAAAIASAAAQQADTAALLASQTEALRTFAMLDGVWRGPATVTEANGNRLTFT